jgi:hypothetical protein
MAVVISHYVTILLELPEETVSCSTTLAEPTRLYGVITQMIRILIIIIIINICYVLPEGHNDFYALV